MTSIDIGAIRVTPLIDGAGRECAQEVLRREAGPNVQDRDIAQVDEGGDLHLTLGGFLIRAGERVVLIDAGAGTIDNGKYRGGQFLESLREEGLEPGDVTDLAFTHLHFDHVGWATQQGAVVFENATHHVHCADWNYFVDDLNAHPGGARKLSPLEGRLKAFAGDTTIASGLDARPMIGHTPGSTAYVISSEGSKLVLIGDLAHSSTELVEPGWSFVHDVDPERASASRQELVEEFTDSGALIAGGHFPRLQPGRLATREDAITWTTT